MSRLEAQGKHYLIWPPYKSGDTDIILVCRRVALYSPSTDLSVLLSPPQDELSPCVLSIYAVLGDSRLLSAYESATALCDMNLNWTF